MIIGPPKGASMGWRRSPRVKTLPALIALAAAAHAQGAAPSRQEVPGGVFTIRGPKGEDFTKVPELELPYVAGLSARFAWSDLEPKRGEYDWKLLEKARETAAKSRKSLMIRVTAGMLSPEWVYELKGVRSVTFDSEDVSWLKAGETVRMPVPWDEGYLEGWVKLVEALGKKIQGWPDVYCVQMTGGGFIGEMHLPKKSEKTMAQWKAAGIDDEKLETVWKRIITAYDANMPKGVGIALDLAMPVPRSKTHQVMYEWSLKTHPGRVWFQQNGLTARWNPEKNPYSKMLREASAKTTVGLQMGGSGEKPGDRRKTFEAAIADQCSYLEIFSNDLVGEKWKAETEFLARGLSENRAKRRKEDK